MKRAWPAAPALMLCAAASAQTLDTVAPAAPSPLAPVAICSLDRSVVIRLDGAPFEPRGLTTVYANPADPAALPMFSTGSTPRNHMLDDGRFTPGPGAGGGLVVSAADVGFVVTDAPSGPFDVVCGFYGTLDLTADPIEQNLVGGFILTFDPPPAPGAYFSGFVDLSGLPGGGVAFPDDDFAYVQWFMRAGRPWAEYPAGKEPAVTALFCGNTPSRNPAGAGPDVGDSLDFCARDTGAVESNSFTAGAANGGADPRELRSFGGAPWLANFYLRMRADLSGRCPPDFNRDGFLDFFDYDAFVACYATGACPAGRAADFNRDGFTDFFDYDQFVEAFDAGC